MTIIDYSGWSLKKSPPMKTSLATLKIMQHHYPERLHLCIGWHPPSVFSAFWKLLSPFIDPVTAKKVFLLPKAAASREKLSEQCAPCRPHSRLCSWAPAPHLALGVDHTCTHPLPVTVGQHVTQRHALEPQPGAQLRRGSVLLPRQPCCSNICHAAVASASLCNSNEGVG